MENIFVLVDLGYIVVNVGPTEMDWALCSELVELFFGEPGIAIYGNKWLCK